MQLFLAKELIKTELNQEGTETIKTLHILLDTARQMVIDSTITHAAICVLILKVCQENSNYNKW